MCKRYSLGKAKQEIEARFEAEMLEDFVPRYNLAPTQLSPVITSENPHGFSHFYWGTTPQFANKKSVSQKLINVPSETVSERVAYKGALQKNRCLIPADSFFEWKTLGKKTKTPYRFTLLEEGLFAFAGLWQEYENEEGRTDHTFLILTTTANQEVAEIHDRMPVILSREEEKKWLAKNIPLEDLLQLLKPYPAEKMRSYPVSPLVNQITKDSPLIIQKTSPMDQFGNYTLFG